MRLLKLYFILPILLIYSCAEELKTQAKADPKEDTKCKEIDCEVLEDIVNQDYDSSRYTNITCKKALTIGEEMEKPVLFYFTGHACVNSRQMEDWYFPDEKIASMIASNFVFVPLFVDDRIDIEAIEVDASSCYQKNYAMTIVERNAFIKCSMFDNQSQPYLVAVDPDGKVLGSFGFLNDSESILMELEKMLN